MEKQVGLLLEIGRFVRKFNRLCLWELFERLSWKDLPEAVPSEGGEGK
jgi:hypothetical protein